MSLRRALAVRRPRAITVLDRAIGSLAGLRRQLASRGADGRYGELWLPRDEEQARRLILNESDPETFERSGREQADLLAEHFGPEDTLLDLGCGIGRVARYVAPRCGLLWAVDASEAMLSYAQERLSEHSNVRLARCLGTRVPALPDGAVDFAYSLLTLQHLEREDAFLLLREVHRVLRPAGRAYLTFPNLLDDGYLASFLGNVEGGHVANPARARFYTPQEVERILPAAGLSVLSLDAGVEVRALCERTG